MVAFLIQNEGREGSVRELECHDEAHAAARATALGLDRIFHYPPADDATPFTVYVAGTATDGRVLVFCKRSADIPRDPDFWTDLHRWSVAPSGGRAVAYPVLSARLLPPSPNGGSQNTPEHIRLWVDRSLDALTVHHVRRAATGAVGIGPGVTAAAAPKRGKRPITALARW
jgi:hypothetical protein